VISKFRKDGLTGSIVVVCLALGLSGCYMGSRQVWSRPAMPDGRGWHAEIRPGTDGYVQPIFFGPEFRLALRAYNYYVTEEVVIPLPVPLDTHPFKKGPLVVEIFVEPLTDALRIDPWRTTLRLGRDGVEVTPTEIYGPVPQRVQGVPVRCCWPRAPVETDAGVTRACQVQERLDGHGYLPLHISCCFTLSFDVDPPDPARAFEVSIDGIQRDGAPISVPLVQFTEWREPWH
jgi:hypothetical protein